MTTQELDLKAESTLSLLRMLKGPATHAAQMVLLDELIEREKQRDVIKNPLGWQAGAIDPAWQVLWNISVEMMGHRSDLLEDASRQERNSGGGIPLFSQRDAAEMLEKYATAITIAAVQMMTQDQRAHSQLSGLSVLAEKYELYLPDELKIKVE